MYDKLYLKKNYDSFVKLQAFLIYVCMKKSVQSADSAKLWLVRAVF